MYLLLALLSLVSIICFYNNFIYLIYFSFILIIISNVICNIKKRNRESNANSFYSPIIIPAISGLIYGIIKSNISLDFICLFVCYASVIQATFNILLMLFALINYKNNKE